MAKGKKKSSKNGRVNGTQKGGSQYGSSDDESLETCSVLSGDSHNPNRLSDNDEDGSGTEEHDTFEDKLKETIDLVSVKSAIKRTAALAALCKAFSEKYCLDFLATRPTTMTDIVEKGLRKGKCEEQAVSATLAGVLCIQYGKAQEGLDMYSNLDKTLSTMLLDATTPPAVREKVALALAVSCFVTDPDDLKKQLLMDQLRQVFSGSYLKGDGVPPTVSPELSQLHQTALLAWSVLLTRFSNGLLALQIVNGHLLNIRGMLECVDVDMRVAAGEALATMYELARERDSDFRWKDEASLCETLHQLATDSHKFRAKKDRKMQKSSFRDILRAVKEGESPDLMVRFSPNESPLAINTWASKRHYDSLCCLLGSGMNHHLSQNPNVREVFNLEPPLVFNQLTANSVKVSKFARHQCNMAADKNRTKALSKVRDKRFDIA